jgi:uncharacterized protein (TIGR02597 family)
LRSSAIGVKKCESFILVLALSADPLIFQNINRVMTNHASLSRRLLGAGALALASALVSAQAQSVATTPVGAMTYSFPATTAVTTTYISIPLTNAAVYTGPVASVTANVITFSGTPFAANGLTGAGNPHFARIATGAQAGRTILITANTTNSITVDTTDNSSQTTALTTSGFAVAANDRIEIIVGDTLASLFGDGTAGNALVFVGGTISGNSDTVAIYNRSTAVFDTYFFSTSSSFWRKSNVSTNANSLVIYPESAIAITRRASRPATSLVLTGDVPAVSVKTKTLGSNSAFYTSTRYPTDVTLGALNLSNWTKANISGQADTIAIYNSSTAKFDTYFQRADNNEWRLSGGPTTNQSGVNIPAGAMIVVLRRGTLSGVSTFTSSAIPYTL